MTHTIEINGVKTEVEIDFHNVLPSGYGHYSINGEARVGDERLKIKTVTTNMEAIDAYKSAQNSEEAHDLAEMRASFESELFDKNDEEIIEWLTFTKED